MNRQELEPSAQLQCQLPEVSAACLPEVAAGRLPPPLARATSECVWKRLCRWPRRFYRKYYLNIEKDHISPVRNYKSGFHFLSRFFPPPNPGKKCNCYI